MINLRTVRWRDYSKLSRWNYIITTVLIRENQGESLRVVLKGVEGVVITEAERVLIHVECHAKTCQFLCLHRITNVFINSVANS